ncbi:MMPL family transporter [uncultured Microbacterium sp.]|uniref:MMPL family transporter n=1 Tax=uncultured Microbacterium sp. TaxID=191216 RepID=UPI0035CBF932
MDDTVAELLYRLGKLAARRAWIVVGVWALVVVIAAIGFAVGFKGLSASFDIPGTASGAVTDELQHKLPDFGGASGTVVFETADGSAFTSEQQSEINALVRDAADLPDVAAVVDPFDTEKQRADQEQQLVDGRQQLDAGSAQLDASQAQLDAGQAQLNAGRAQLDAARQQAVAAGAPPEQVATLDAQKVGLDAQQAQLTAGQAKLEDSRAELETQTTTLDNGASLSDLSRGIRTVSEDGSTAVVNIAYSPTRTELSQASKDATIEYFEAASIDGVDVSISTDIAMAAPQILGVGEVVGVVFAAIALLVMLGSIIAAALPLVTALLGVIIGILGTLAFSGVTQMASITPFLGLMLGLAVGIDYSLFIINRHRKQLLQGAEPRESIGLANGTAGNAVVFAGATVVVALVALNVTGIPFLGLMGTVGAIVVAIAVLIAITLTPAILGLLGTRVLSRRSRARMGRIHHGMTKAKPMPTWRAIVTVVFVSAALLIVAVPGLSMRVGLPDGGSEPVESTAYVAYSTTEREFGAGANGPLLVTAQLPAGLNDDQLLQATVDVAQAIADLDDVVAVAPIAVSDDNLLAAFQVVPAHGPNSVSTENLVVELRGMDPVDGDITISVAGAAASNIDISEKLAAVLPTYLAVVIGLSLIIMVLVFRSILVPLIATGGFILSLFATFGAIVAVFQWGWGADALGIHTGPILSFLPVLLVGILFGLAMDYQLFLGSGMREAYVHGDGARVAVVRGLRSGRSVVTAAGLIMVSVFGGFIFSESTMIRSIGFGLALGVLLDAFVVRMLLMPALMHLLGKSAWWIPRWLDRILPNVDVEGASLRSQHPAPPEADSPRALQPAHR